MKQDGSTALTLIVSLMTIGLAAVAVENSQMQISKQIASTQRERSLSAVADANLSAASRLRALFALRNDGGTYSPALFAENYYEAEWKLLPNAAAIKNVAFKSGKSLKIAVAVAEGKSTAQVESILNGSSAFDGMGMDDLSLEILKTHFSADQRAATAVDVKISGEQSGKTFVSNVRVPLAVPMPEGPILEVAPQGTENFSRAIDKLTPGKYTLRILGSGVVFSARLEANGKEEIVGGFDKTTGRISHKAINIKAKDEEIGRMDFEIKPPGADSFDTTVCTYQPATGGYTLSGQLVGADATIVSDIVSVLGTPFVKEFDDAEMQLAYETKCTAECPVVPVEGMDTYMAPPFGDLAELGMVLNTAKNLNIRSKKLCLNLENAGQAFHTRDGSYPTHFVFQVVFDPTMAKFIDFVTYDFSSCERHFLYERNNCGCLADNTMILLGDGSTEKKISEIDYQDKIWNPARQEAMSILKITRGPEPVPLLNLMVKGQELRVTGQHPMRTQRGLEPAHALQEGDLLLLNDGTWSRLEAVEHIPSPATAPIVWNIELATSSSDSADHQFVANGIVTGDLYLQTQLHKRERKGERPIP